MLNVGGGHALYSVAVSDRNPSVSGTVFDDAAIEAIARENVPAAGLADRMSRGPTTSETSPDVEPILDWSMAVAIGP